MNERIKELVRQAYIADAKRFDGWVETKSTDKLLRQLDGVFEKFAELIVRECAHVARNTNLEDVEGGDSAVLRAAGEQIKEHFGVE